MQKSCNPLTRCSHGLANLLWTHQGRVTTICVINIRIIHAWWNTPFYGALVLIHGAVLKHQTDNKSETLRACICEWDNFQTYAWTGANHHTRKYCEKYLKRNHFNFRYYSICSYAAWTTDLRLFPIRLPVCVMKLGCSRIHPGRYFITSKECLAVHR